MRKLHVVCPECGTVKRIGVPAEIFDHDDGSLLNILIRSGTICQHSFIAYVDYHFSIRGTASQQDYKKMRDKFGQNEIIADSLLSIL